MRMPSRVSGDLGPLEGLEHLLCQLRDAGLHEDEGRGGGREGLLPREGRARDVDGVRFGQAQAVEVGLGALFELRQLLEVPVGGEDHALALLPEEVELFEVLLDDVEEDGRPAELPSPYPPRGS